MVGVLPRLDSGLGMKGRWFLALVGFLLEFAALSIFAVNWLFFLEGKLELGLLQDLSLLAIVSFA